MGGGKGRPTRGPLKAGAEVEGGTVPVMTRARGQPQAGSERAGSAGARRLRPEEGW